MSNKIVGGDSFIILIIYELLKHIIRKNCSREGGETLFKSHLKAQNSNLRIFAECYILLGLHMYKMYLNIKFVVQTDMQEHEHSMMHQHLMIIIEHERVSICSLESPFTPHKP